MQHPRTRYQRGQPLEPRGQSPLAVEGLTFVRTPVVETDDQDLGYRIINSFQAPLFVANCEFRNRFVIFSK